MDKPKPCPFCGSSNVSVVEGTTFRWRAVECECQARGPEARMGVHNPDDYEWEGRNAIEEWNRRADDAMLKAREVKP